MKIGILGDTHGDKKAIDKMIKKAGEVSFYLHTGDYIDDAVYLENKSGKIVYAICGNCDQPCKGDYEKLITIDGKKIFLTHGHKYHVKDSLNHLFYKGAELEADAIIFGHTHVAVHYQESGMDLFNPGSLHSPKGNIHRTFGVLEIQDGRMIFNHYSL